MMLTKGLFTSKTDEWGTPKSIFDELNKTFHFTIDVCADASNHKCDKYFTKEQDGLRQDWGGCYMVQPSVWQRNWEVGGKVCDAPRSGGYASAS